MHEHNLFYDTFEASGTSSGCVWKPFFPDIPGNTTLKAFLTHVHEHYVFYATLKASGSSSGRVWKVCVGCIPGNHMF